MNTDLKFALALAALVLFHGCAQQSVRLSDDGRKAMSAETGIHAVHHSAYGVFQVESTGYSAAGALFSPLVAIAAVNEGMALQRDLHLEDPAPYLKDRLVAAMRADLGIGNVNQVTDVPKNDSIANLSRTFPNGIVLDVRTMHWGIDNARAKYSARTRLVRLPGQEIIWQATCKAVADATEAAPSMEALQAKDGALLKAKLLRAVDGCAEQFSAWITAKAR